jgi:hypothetical protein
VLLNPLSLNPLSLGAVPVEQLWRVILPSQDHNVGIERPILVLDFITTFWACCSRIARFYPPTSSHSSPLGPVLAALAQFC